MKYPLKIGNDEKSTIRGVAVGQLKAKNDSLKQVSVAPYVAQLARGKLPRPARKVGGRRVRDPFRRQENIIVKILSKPRIESAIRRSLESKVWRKMVEMNPQHDRGDLRQRGQETNNILHTGRLERVAPHARNPYQAMMRHLSTVLAEGNMENFVEVQAAITFSNEARTQGTVYVSANAHERDLIDNWDGIRDRAQTFDGLGNTRLERHSRKAIAEIAALRDNFNIQIVSTGVQNQHAETRIDDHIRDPNAIYGGLRSPCGACRINFQLKGRAHALYDHTGQLWTTKAASLSIERFALPIISRRVVPERVRLLITKDNVTGIVNRYVNEWIAGNEDRFRLPHETYVQGQESVRDARGHDTDSEEEDA
ncbi:MAG: hypothetical protein ABJG47_00765 [Ekhidna sp.]